VGESGSGKSVTALSVLDLVPGARLTGSIRVGGDEVLGRAAGVRGRRVAIVFQEPMTSLNPVFTAGEQVAEVLRCHRRLGRREAWAVAGERFVEVGLEPAHRSRYPHQLSGGQKQRVVLAMALACDPEVLIADEPTTALDGLVQRQVLDLLRSIQAHRGMAVLFISHDLRVVAQVADRVAVMRAGRVVEEGPVREVLDRPKHEYTRLLLDSIPSGDRADGVGGDRLLEAAGLSVRLGERAVLHDVTLSLRAGETLGVLGPSGSGKTTLGRALLRLVPATGSIRVLGREWMRLRGAELRRARPAMQMVFQDPFSSLAPHLTVGEALREPMLAHGLDDPGGRSRRLMAEVGLSPEHLDRRPHAFSGGQRQRIGLARALATDPRVLVCDECTSSLDVTIQAQILDLLLRLQAERGLALLFISHDLSVVRRMSHRVIVLDEGRVVEEGATAEVVATPRHAVTRALVELGRRESGC
jgi:ABC-type glutathione transport system ATPase component